jgi:hypothetical protein
MNRRLLAWILVAYGISGLGVLVTGAVVGMDAVGRIESTANDAYGTLDAAERSIRAASDSFSSIDRSLADAEASALSAADLARDASGTLNALASAMQLNILGTQPLSSLADEFSASADEAGALAVSLDGVAASLGETRPDVAAIGTELASLADELGALRPPSAAGEPLHLRLFVGLLLVWLVVPAIGALVVGIAILRREARRSPDPG